MLPRMIDHLNDDELIASLYDASPPDAHLASCAECQARVATMRAHRLAVEADAAEEISFDFLAAQRRSIYAQLTESSGWSPRLRFRAWASAAVGVLVLAGGLFIYEQKQAPPVSDAAISDAQLAQQVSNMAQDPEPSSTAPLQALFEE